MAYNMLWFVVSDILHDVVALWWISNESGSGRYDPSGHPLRHRSRDTPGTAVGEHVSAFQIGLETCQDVLNPGNSLRGAQALQS